MLVITSLGLFIYTSTSGHTDDAGLENQIFPSDDVVRLKIEIQADDMVALTASPRVYVRCAVTEKSNKWSNVGVHLKGGSGSGQQLNGKPSLTLNFGSFGAELRFHGLEKLHLNNCQQDPTYLHQVLCADVFRCAGVPCPRATHAFVELNGRKLGLYVLQEAVEGSFLKRYFPDPHGTLYQGTYVTDISDGVVRTWGDSPRDRRDLEPIRDALRQADGRKRFLRVSECIDVDQFYRFMAAEVITCHADGYVFAANNYRFFSPRVGTGSKISESNRLVFIPSGMDRMLGQPISPVFTSTMSSIPRTLLATTEGRSQYLARLQGVFTNCFRVEELTNRIISLRNRLHDYMVSELPSSSTIYDLLISNLISRVEARAYYLKQYFDQIPVDARRGLSDRSSLEGIQDEQAPGSQIMSVGFPIGCWRIHDQHSCISAFLTNSMPSGAALTVVANSTQLGGIGAWRAKVLLDRGKYRIEGGARLLFDSQYSSAAPPTVFLLSSVSTNRNEVVIGSRSSAINRLILDVTIDEHSELLEVICGAKLFRAGVTFPADSFRIVRTQ